MERIASHCLSGTHSEAEAIAATYLRLATAMPASRWGWLWRTR
ncbi:hypothetical protein [Methylobacterium nigriterrae]